MFYGIVFVFALWLLLTVGFFVNERNSDSYYDNIDLNSVELDRKLREKKGFSNYQGNTAHYVYANYDKTPHRNPNEPGELGVAVYADSWEKEKENEGYTQHSFNRLVSDKISLQRNLRDYRNSK